MWTCKGVQLMSVWPTMGQVSVAVFSSLGVIIVYKIYLGVWQFTTYLHIYPLSWQIFHRNVLLGCEWTYFLWKLSNFLIMNRLEANCFFLICKMLSAHGSWVFGVPTWQTGKGCGHTIVRIIEKIISNAAQFRVINEWFYYIDMTDGPN